MSSTCSVHRRLVRDLSEYRRAAARGELKNIVAAPLDDDIREWHANVRAAPGHSALDGLILHLVLRFPSRYCVPPTVEICTSIPHPMFSCARAALRCASTCSAIVPISGTVHMAVVRRRIKPRRGANTDNAGAAVCVGPGILCAVGAAATRELLA